MLARRSARRGLFTVAFALTAALGGSALAAPPLVLTTTATLEGKKTYSEVTIEDGARLSVKSQVPDAQMQKGLGWLHLVANRITVKAGGLITAKGAGYLGINNMNGEGDGPGVLGAVSGEPGGGGAFGGNGGVGTLEACTAVAGSLGGTAYPTLLTFGSAGGAANVNAQGTRGGHGGGRIILEAAVVEILGTVEADGDDGLTPSGVGSGAGAGGAIQIIAHELITGPTSVLSAKGGKGGNGTNANGGGGGGGRILIAGTAPLGTQDVAGGPGGEPCTVEGQGAPGLVEVSVPPPCPDADQDGETSDLCGGTDCDDADENIRPGAEELCDGFDNNCANDIDDEIEVNACPMPQVCTHSVDDAGLATSSCEEPPDAGSDAGDPNAARPDQIDLKGGCSLGGTPAIETTVPPLVAAAVGALGAALLRARRRRRARSGRSS